MDKMEKLSNPQKTIEVLQKYNFTFQKKFGQNFLIDPHVLDKIIAAAEITKDDFVLEIDAGIGTLTQYLAEAAREVVAVEIDSSLIPILEDTLSSYDNVSVINEDVLKVDLKKLAEERMAENPSRWWRIFRTTSRHRSSSARFESHVPLKSLTVMVQKEVALRMQVVGNKGLRCSFPGSPVLCRSLSGSQCAAKLLYAPSECGKCRDPADPF